MWRCGAVPCTKNYSPPSSNEELYTTAPQCKTLHCKTLCWFVYFTASRVHRRLVFLPSIEYRIKVEVECYHSYNNCYILIMKTVSLLSSYHHTHCPLQSRHCKGLVISYSSTATAVYLKVRPHYAAWQNATHCSFATWQKLLGICCQCDRIQMKKKFFANLLQVTKTVERVR